MSSPQLHKPAGLELIEDLGNRLAQLTDHVADFPVGDRHLDTLPPIGQAQQHRRDARGRAVVGLLRHRLLHRS